jgi:hypothetical protein
MKIFFAALFAMLVSGCVSLPTQQEAASADHGSYPSDYEQIAKDFYGNILKDPSSAQYRNIAAPKKAWLGDRFNGAKYGYIVCVTLNAKNSYGAYIGFQTDGLLIRNGVVIQYVAKGDWFGHQMC